MQKEHPAVQQTGNVSRLFPLGCDDEYYISFEGAPNEIFKLLL